MKKKKKKEIEFYTSDAIMFTSSKLCLAMVHSNQMVHPRNIESYKKMNQKLIKIVCLVGKMESSLFIKKKLHRFVLDALNDINGTKW